MQGNRRNMTGFTLVELMIVLAIIAIVAAVAIPSYDNYRKRSDRAEAQSTLMTAASAMERYKLQRFTYNGATAGTATTSTISSVTPASGTVKYNISFVVGGATVATNTNGTTYEIRAISTRAMDGSASKQEVLQIDNQGRKCFKTGSSVTSCTYGTDASW